MVIWDRDAGVGSDTFGELDRLRRRMNRLFGPSLMPGMRDAFPPVNVWSDSEKAVVCAEAPGMKKEDIDLSVENDVLTITGRREPEKLEDEDTYRRQERGYGRFRRAVGLPFGVDPEKVNAEYQDGILCIELPRHEASKPKQIAVK